MLIVAKHLFDLVEQKHIVGKQYEGPSQLLRKWFIKSLMRSCFSSPERGESLIRNRLCRFSNGNKEIFIADFDGADAKQITQNRSINISPAWSPDGKKIAFTTYLNRNPDLYLIDTDGTECADPEFRRMQRQMEKLKK
jgi:TolB protein